MSLTDFLRTLDDILGRATTSGVHMTRSPLLSESRSTTGFDDISHIAQRVPILRSVRRLEITAHRRAATIVIHNHGVFLRSVKILRQVETAIDGIALRVREVPVLASANLSITKSLRTCKVSLTLFGFQIKDISRGRLHRLIREVTNDRSVCCHIIAISIVAINRQLRDFARLRIQHKHIHVVTILGREINQTIGTRPFHTTLNAGVEILGERCHLLRSDIIEKQFVLRHAGRHALRQLTADAVESLRITPEEELSSIGRETTAAKEALTLQHGIHLQRLGIHDIDILYLCRTLG